MGKTDKKEKILILVIIALGIFIALNLFKNDKVTFIKDHDYLYEKAIDYLLKNDDNIDKNKDNYKMFIAYKKFGIAQDKKNIYAYMWIVSESYYVENNELVTSTSDSIPHKITFDKTNEKLIKDEITGEGNQRNISIKNMFPKSIQNEIIDYEDNTNMQKQVYDYYKEIVPNE